MLGFSFFIAGLLLYVSIRRTLPAAPALDRPVPAPLLLRARFQGNGLHHAAGRSSLRVDISHHKPEVGQTLPSVVLRKGLAWLRGPGLLVMFTVCCCARQPLRKKARRVSHSRSAGLSARILA